MKKIIGCEDYSINEEGKVFNKLGRLIKQQQDKDGYFYVAIGKRGKNYPRKHYSIHRLLAMLYIDNPLKYKVVMHINGINTDNALSNLKWGTQSQNVIDGFAMGRKVLHGECSHSRKLTSEDVISIKKSLNQGKTLQSLASNFNVSTSAISNIKRNKKWVRFLKEHDLL